MAWHAYLRYKTRSQGDISGVITTGVDPRPLSHDNPIQDAVEQPDGSCVQPAPRWTQCTTFDSNNTGTIDDYVAVIVGVIGGKRYAVTLEVSMLAPEQGYTHLGTIVDLPDNFSGSISVYEAGGQDRQWSDVFGPAMQSSSIVLHADRKSGAVDAWLALANQDMQAARGTLHIQGGWRCG